MVGPEGIEPSTLGLKVSSEGCRVVSSDDERCPPARDSGVAGIGPIRLVVTNIRVNVVRMWSVSSFREGSPGEPILSLVEHAASSWICGPVTM